MELLTTKEAFEQAVKNNASLVLLKHSLTCPISSKAKRQFVKFHENHEVPSYIIHIQENRDLSDYVAEYFGIKHESPQVFLIKNGEVIFDASHWNVTAKKLEKVVQ
ncbi:bacillithiol system redox-active protein YtxJ [Filobacillus milosensis]|uniref:Bacillithiol system redox-active protein YtxJ n=1 Tax=Filobacillus milosensis TaxID=94137 RepID=A0A4Y8ITD5_9BACI|nr:bacillithiol system redox-active protein YtxJ [Filobacillus milosensis]TFB25072.1 bacillithiol system redox-active protein YtxJ [Filobacillus milosensis]